MKDRVKFADSRSNSSRDLRLSHFVTNDDHDDAGVRRSSLKGKTPNGVLANKKPTNTNWWGRQNAAQLKFDPKSSEAAIG